MTTQVKRFSDSGPRDHLCVLRQDDGDICLEIYCNGPGMLNTGFIGTEFCLPGVGGGQSPETVKALRNLIAAMKKDNQDHPQNRGKDEPFTDRKADHIEELEGGLKAEGPVCINCGNQDPSKFLGGVASRPEEPPESYFYCTECNSERIEEPREALKALFTRAEAAEAANNLDYAVNEIKHILEAALAAKGE